MKKIRFTALVLTILLIASLITLPVSAASKGSEELAEAASGKNPLMNPEYIAGGNGFNESEGAASLFMYDEDNKYCTDQLPYWAEWKYDKGYVVNRVIIRTANDSAASIRRMGNGWTLSGSNDGSSWEVIYTGTEDDMEDEDFIYYYVDLPDNAAEYQYYRLNSDIGGEDNQTNENGQLIQVAAIVLCEGEGEIYVAPWKPKNFRIGTDTTVITAVDFDAGIYGKAPADGSKDIRHDEEVNTEVGESEFGGNIGWIAAGDWVQYTVTVQQDGKYKIGGWLASDADPTGGIKIYYDDTEVGTSPNCDKNGWQSYALYTAAEEVEMTAGSHVIKVEFTGGVNFSALEVTRTGDLAAAETEAPPAVDEGAAEDTAPDGENEPAPTADSTDSGESVSVLFIIIGIAILVIIVVIIVLVSKKKK